MRALPRRLTPFLLLGVTSVYVAFHGRQTGDYKPIFAPAMDALLSGHPGGFFSHLPLDGAGGSVLLRAPAALLGKVLIGGYFGPYRFGAALCLLATGVVGLWLARGARARSASPTSAGALVAVFALAPAALNAISYGHPEEPLGAALCLAAVVIAAARRPALAGAVLGLAIINKPWALLALAPVVLAAPERRLVVLASAGVLSGGFAAVCYLASPHQFGEVLRSGGATVLAHPPELWWPLARWDTRLVANPLWHALHGPGPTAGYFPPRLLAGYARDLPLLVAGACAVAVWCRRRAPEFGPPGALALLALLFGLRCLSDPGNYVYYEIPFVMALAVWEAWSGRTPVMAIASLAGAWFIFNRLPEFASADAQYVIYLALTLPVLALLAGPAVGRRARTGAAGVTRAAPAV